MDKWDALVSVSKLGVGAFLVYLHVTTGQNGFLLLLIALMFGVPAEIILAKKKEKKEDEAS